MRKLKFVTIPEDYFQYIDTVDYKCFLDQCEEVVKKQTNKKKQAISTLCMIEMWMVYRCFRKYIDTVVKLNNAQLTEKEKNAYHYKAECNSFLDEY